MNISWKLEFQKSQYYVSFKWMFAHLLHPCPIYFTSLMILNCMLPLIKETRWSKQITNQNVNILNTSMTILAINYYLERKIPQDQSFKRFDLWLFEIFSLNIFLYKVFLFQTCLKYFQKCYNTFICMIYL